MKQLNQIREISVYSNCEDTRLDYRKRYQFHHWTKAGVALIENMESGRLLEVDYKNFGFIG